VTQLPGGVARNVAHSLALLAAADTAAALPAPTLIAVVGCDPAGNALLDHWRSMGLSTACIHQLADVATPCVSIIFDSAGDVAASVADVASMEGALTLELLHQHAADLRGAPMVLVDADLGRECIEVSTRVERR
jgi:sugar/nucleoside kinase (ribokinase family)